MPPKDWNNKHFLQTQYRGLGQQQGLGQQSLQQQPGFQQGLAQPGFQQGLSQPGFQQGLQQGLAQPGFQQGLNQGFRSAPPAPPMPPKNWNHGHFLQQAQQNRLLGQQQGGFQQPLGQQGLQQGLQYPQQQGFAQQGLQQGLQYPQQNLGQQGYLNAPPAPPLPAKNWNHGHFLQRAQQNRLLGQQQNLGQQNLYGQPGFQQPLPYSSFASPMMGSNLPQQSAAGAGSFNGQKAELLSGGAIPQQAGGSLLQAGAPLAQPHHQAGGAPRVSTKPAHKWLA